MSLPFTVESLLSKVSVDLAKQQDSIIMAELNELVSRGLLVVEQTQPVIVKARDSDTLELRQKMRLVLKDQEYIQALEAQNKQLKEQLEGIKSYIFSKAETK
jgi:hypothetical protein